MKQTLLCLCILCSAISSFSQVYYKYQILDAAEANKIYNATGGSAWTHRSNWPASTGITMELKTPYGISFAYLDTMLFSYPPPAIDTGIVHMMIKEIDLSQNNLSGVLPAFSLDSLKKADFSDNHLTGLGEIHAPALKSLELYTNSIPVLPVFKLPSLQILGMGGNLIQGQLTQWETPALEYLNLALNNLSGVTNVTYPNLSYLNLYYNNITGEIPNWNFPKLKELDISGNHFTGNIPPFNFPLMEIFKADYNSLTGEIPDFNWPNLILFWASQNQLSGDLPDLTAPMLQSYILRENKLTGDLKNIDFPGLQYLDLDYNQLDGIIKSPIYLPALIRFKINNNDLKGELIISDLSEVQEININFNDFSGEFPNVELPKLYRLHIQENNFTRLPDFAAGSDALTDVDCRVNRLHFEDLLPYKDVPIFRYEAMQPVDMFVNLIADSIHLSVNVRGEGNKYKWYNSSGNIANSDSNVLVIYKTEKPEEYGCVITNPLLPGLALLTQLAQQVIPPCWDNGIFSVCITSQGEGWEKGDEANEIQTTKAVSINDFILFEGALILDTVDLEMKINGKFYLENILLPGGNVGNFTLAQGKYTLALAGSDGSITGFINDALSTYVPQIGGLKIKLEKLKLVGGFHATGVSLSFKISWDNIIPSCGTTSNQTTAINIEGLKITTDGVDVSGVKVEDMGFAPKFCLKKFVASYDRPKDKLSFGLSILTPFIEVGAGLGLVGGMVDSIAMKAELQNIIIPIGTTGIGVIGCEGWVSSIKSPPWNMRFGGIFSAVVNDDLFRLTTSVEYIPPAELKIEAGDGKFFNTHFDDDWWLMEGGIYGSINFKTESMKAGGQIKIAPYKSGDTKKFIGNGSIDMSYRNEANALAGKFNGSFTVPKLSDSWPFDWLDSKLNLPYTATANGVLVYKPETKFIVGTINFSSRIGDLQYRIELAKPYSDPDYFTLTVVDGQVTPVHAATFDYTFNVPDETTMAVVKASHTTELPVVSLRQPDGTEISESMPSANAELDKDALAYKTFWTLYTPQPGLWRVSTEAIGAEIKVYYFEEGSQFSITATQEADGIHVTWNPAMFATSDSIDFFADDDQEDYDGIYMMTVGATLGATIIPNEVFENQCAFNLQALAYQEQSVLTDYAEPSFTNSISTFGLPEDIVVNLNTPSLLLHVSWTPSAHPNIAGYVIELIENGISRVIGMPYSDEHTFTYQLDAYTGQRLVIYAYGTEGEVSCASKEYELTTSAVEDLPETEITENLFVYPNPFTDICTIRITSRAGKMGTLRVFNNQGVLLRTLPQISLLKGTNEVPLSMSDMPPGNYFITCHSGNTVLTSQVIVVR